MRLAILAAFCVAAVSAELSNVQQARLSELLEKESNAELRELLAVKRSGRAAHSGGKPALTRSRRESVSVFDITAQVAALQFEFNQAVNSGQITDIISASIASSIENNGALLNAVRSQAKVKADLLLGLEAGVAGHAQNFAAFKTGMWNKVTDLEDGVLKQASARTALEKDLDSSLTAFQEKVDAQLTSLDSLPDQVTEQIDDKLKPIASSLKILDRLALTYLSNPKIPVFRWNWWHTHQHGSTSWFDGNNPRGYGGVHPSTWTDGNGCANDMNGDFKYLKRLFVIRGTADKYGASVCQETYIMHSSTTGRMCGVLWRIKNTKTSAIGWNPQWMYSSFGGWGEYASVSLNGANNFRNHCNHSWCRNNINLNIPSNSAGDRISTIIFISSSTGAYHMGHSNHERANFNHYNDNSLNLADGLEFVDDLDTVTGNWKQ